jgi:hypothetical protein
MILFKKELGVLFYVFWKGLFQHYYSVSVCDTSSQNHLNSYINAYVEGVTFLYKRTQVIM